MCPIGVLRLRMEPVSQRQVSLNQSRTVGPRSWGDTGQMKGLIRDLGPRVKRGGLEAGETQDLTQWEFLREKKLGLGGEQGS